MMRARLLSFPLVFACVAVVAVPRSAAPAGADESETAHGLTGIAVYRLESHLGKNLVDLARAIPEESWDWRPSEEVRTVGELFKHVGSANVWFGVQLGAEKPVDAPDWKELDGKAEIVAGLEGSFDFLKSAMRGLDEEELDREVEFFGRRTTVRELVLNAMTHDSEHLGQAIAYARSLGVVPPWNRDD